MNHFDRIRSQIVGGDNRRILRERETGEKFIDDRRTFQHEFCRPALIGFCVHIDSHTGIVALISAAIYDPRMCGRLYLCIDLRNNVRVN